MAELLVRAISNDHLAGVDAEKDRAATYKAGDIVVAMPDGHEWGALEGPPGFVVVQVPGLAHSVAEDRVQVWEHEYDFEVLNWNIALDGWRFRVVNLQRRGDGSGTPTRARIRTFFERWGATFVRIEATGVVLDWTIEAGATSEGFLGADPVALGVTIAETGYVRGTGVHRYSADWMLTPNASRLGLRLAKRIASLGGTITDFPTPTSANYTLSRNLVRDAFIRDVKRARAPYRRRRYSFSPADVSSALAAGGTVTLTAAQVASRVIDHRA